MVLGGDDQVFHPGAGGHTLRLELGIAPEAPLIVMVARLERVKGHAVFFAALKKLAETRRFPALRAVCACDERTAGVYDQTVTEARTLGLGPDLLTFTGLRADVEGLIAAANVVALPSLGSEGSSRVALEAAACGVPLVASLPEVVLEGQTGLLVPHSQPQKLADALAVVLENPERARQMGRLARARAEERYDERAMGAKLEALYLDAAGHH